jgi:cytochrome c biogenesis protein
MVIIQQNVEGFDAFFASRTPAEKLIFGSLGLFDIYHSWYYNVLLLILSLNIVLASIDRFPGAWKYISDAKKTATRAWLLNLKQSVVAEVEGADESEVANKIRDAFEAEGWKPKVSEEEYSTYATDESGKKDFDRIQTRTHFYVFGEKGKWNRIGAYIVHVCLLTLFLGHFVSLQFGFDADIRLTPDTNPQVLSDFDLVQKSNTIQLIKFKLDKQERFNVELPFTITCQEIEQRLINTGGEIEINNTMDWRTRIKIDDPEYGETVGDVSLNNPFTYRGYRFFQASAVTIGSASSMTFELTPDASGEQPITLVLKRNETATLPNGTKIEYENFLPDFVMKGNQFSTQSAEYNNPVAILRVTTPAKEGKPEETTKVFAFANKLPDSAPIAAPKAGYRWHMKDYVKSPLAHILSIKYDPFGASFIAWYVGGLGLVGALAFVFFSSHRRVWAMIDRKDDGRFEVVFGGDANRNNLAFEDKFRTLVGRFAGDTKPATEDKG